MKSITLLAAFLLTVGCGSTTTADPSDSGATDDGTGGGDSAGGSCTACVGDTDCSGQVCAQFGGDTYCATPCPNATCGAGATCTAVTTSSGDPTNVCVPDACRGSTPDAGKPVDAGTGTVDAGPVTAQIGPNGGTESKLYFGIIGDTRPPLIDDTAGYPTTTINKLYADLAAQNPAPPFIVTTGDYVFAKPSGSQAAAQFKIYNAARAKYAGVVFPALGNHECTGATTSNCGTGNVDGITNNYSQFISAMLTPIGKPKPYYVVNVNATDASWTAKFVFVAANAWDTTQATWLSQTLAVATTYTFIVRHEPAEANTAPGVTPSEQIMAQHPYTLAITGHTHTYSHYLKRQIVVGNGGAPLTSAGNFGFALITQLPNKSIQVDMLDVDTQKADLGFRFTLTP